MRIKTLGSIVAVAVCMGIAVPAGAQSLADVARQEDARRKSTKGTGKIYTNDDLKPVPAMPATPVPSGTPADPGTPKPDAPATAAVANDDLKPTEPAAALPIKDEAYWKGRMNALRQQLDRDTTYADAMQSRVNALTTDFTNRDDPAQRALIGVSRQRALAELDRLKTEIEDGKKAIAALEEEARRASVPAGWLR